MSTSKFPQAIDGYLEIRVVRDRIEEIVGNDHNSMRSATLNIERCLGINPQGHFGTVVERLDNGAQDIVDHASGASPRHYDDHIDALVKSGSPWGLASGTVETQVQQLLDYENEFLATTGAGLVGAAAFNTPGNEYSFEGLTVQDQIEEAGSFLDENANYLMRAFDSFVVSGMLVTPHNSVDLMVNVASGYVSGQGRLIHYDAQVSLVLLTAPGVGEYYVYARRNANTIEISGVSSANLSTVLDPENPIVLLAKITLTAGPNASSFDIRKFGVSSSSKNGFSVGTKPTSGRDGYGCDFISLSAAVEYIKALRDSGKNIGPSRIILVSDLVINNNAGANIALPSGIEIDGCGNKILFLVDNCLFYINNSNIILKNISVETNVSSFSTLSNLIFVAQTGNIKNLYINNVILTNLSSPMHYFMRFGPYELSNSIICNCSVEVERGGFSTVDDLATGNPITGCSIFNNRIYQTPFSVSSYNGIVIGSNNKVYGNVIDGGFTYGIVIRQSNYGNSISDNTIIGYRSNVVSMVTGIYTNNSNNVSITNNIVKGINTYGINCSSVDTLLGIIVTGNLITNRDVSSTLPAATIGIFGSVNGEVSASNNMITYMKSSSIKNVKEIKNNYIVNHTLGNTVNSIYVDSCNFAVVESNYIKNSPGRSIYLVNCDNAVVNNNKVISPAYDVTGKNVIYVSDCNYLNLSNNSIFGNVGGGSSSLGIGIYASSYCNIANTFVYKLNSVAFRVEVGSLFCNFENNYIFGTTGGFTFDSDCTNAIIKANILIGDATYTALEAIYYPGIESVIESNYIYGFGNSPATCVVQLDTSDDCIIHGNYILNCFGNGVECNGSSGLSICDNQFKMLTGFASSGIIDVGTDSLISNNIFSGYSGTISDPYGVSIEAGADNVKIIGNSFSGIGAGMTNVFYANTGCGYLEISDNYVLTFPGTAIDLNGSSNCIIDNNILIGDPVNSSSAIKQLGSYCVVTGNIFKSIGAVVSSYGIQSSSGASSLQISGNVFSDNQSNLAAGIYMVGSGSGHLICDNNLITVPKIGIDLGSNTTSCVSGNFVSGSNTGVASNHLLTGTGAQCYISDNRLFSANYYSVLVGGSQWVCSNNYIICGSASNNAIALSNGVTQILISGNYISSYADAIQSGSVSNIDVVISNNYIIILGANNGIHNNYLTTSAPYWYITDNKIVGTSGSSITAIKGIGSNSFVSNNYIDRFGASSGYGIITSSAASDSGINIINNFLYRPNSAMDSAIKIGNASSYGNHINNNIIGTSSGGVSKYGIHLNAAIKSTCCNNIIYGSDVSGAYHAIYSSGVGSVTAEINSINNNFIVKPNGYGIYAGTFHKVSGNYIFIDTPTGKYGIYATSYSGVSNNDIVGGEYGIYSNSVWNNIKSNSIANSTIAGIFANTNASEQNIIGNYIIQTAAAIGIKLNSANHNSKISSNYIYNAASSIACLSSNYCSITDNYISLCTTGITYDTGDYFDIANNYISGFTSIGISLLTSANGGKISSNYLYRSGAVGTTYGIKVDTSGNNKISSNYIYNTASSIACLSSNNCSINDNYILTCTTGITYNAGDYFDIANNYISGFTNTGISLLGGATNGKISSNYLYSGSVCGISIDTCNNNKISSNYICNTPYSISCISSDYCSITDNYILTCDTGITYNTGDYYDIANNYISGFTYCGIYILTSATNGKTSSNYLYRSGAVGTTYGIRINACNNNKISSNYIYNTASSIFCYNSNSCSIVDNYILTCTTGITYNTGDYFDIANNYISGFTDSGIHLLTSATNGKISSNYLYLFVPVGITHGIKIYASSNNNKISSNYIFSTTNSILCDNSNSCSITDNYIYTCTTGITYTYGDYFDIANNYIGGFTFRGIYLGFSANSSKISSNYLYLTGTQVGETYGIIVHTCNSSFISSNYIYNYLTSGSYSTYVIYVTASSYIGINDNYILCNNQELTTSIYINESGWVNVLGNNLISIGTYGIFVQATSDKYNFNICSNYIASASSANITSGINISSSYTHMITISNNHISISPSTNGNGIVIGDSGITTTSRSISCMSNFAYVKLAIYGAPYVKAFDYSGSSISLIGNVAYGGSNPESWATDYGATITSGNKINNIMNVYRG